MFFFNFLFMFAFLFCTLLSILTILCFCIVLCNVSPFVHSCPFLIFVKIYRPLPHGGNPVVVNKYHILSQNSPIIGVYCSVFLYTHSVWSLSASWCVQNSINFRHRHPCSSNRMTDSQLGPCLSIDNNRQFSYRYRHTKDHIVSARSNVKYVTKYGWQ